MDAELLKVGQVIEVRGQKIKIKVFSNKNSAILVCGGDIIKNICVGNFLKISKGYSSIVCKVEGEYIQDLKKKHDYFCLWHQPQLSFSLPNGETYEEVVFRLNDFILEKYNENPQQTIFITIHGMLFTILHGIFLDLPVERLNEVNQEIVRGCSLSLFEFDGKKHKIDQARQIYHQQCPSYPPQSVSGIFFHAARLSTLKHQV